jgi:hypothetical protein
MAFLRRQEIGRHGGAAGIIKLLCIRLRLPLYRLDVTEIGLAAVEAAYPGFWRRKK